jgi:hypothetical protein
VTLPRISNFKFQIREHSPGAMAASGARPGQFPNLKFEI